jgi:hypothetical protein
MKAIVAGLPTINPEFFCLLEEPVPFELSINLKNYLILGESSQEIRVFLRELRELLPENDLSSRRLFEAISQAPKSRSTLRINDCDINIEDHIDVVTKLTGAEFEKFQNDMQMNAVRGDSRSELFNRNFSRLIMSTSSICIVDKYFGNQFSKDDYKRSGAFWALQEILKYDVPLIRILTSPTDASKTKIDERLRELHLMTNGETKLEVYLGRAPHNRHITFNFTGGVTPYSIILDKGLEIFQFENLREAPGISEYNSVAALSNESQVLNSHSSFVKIDRSNKKSA